MVNGTGDGVATNVCSSDSIDVVLPIAHFQQWKTDQKISQHLLDLDKRNLSSITTLFTNHGSLRYHLKKMGSVGSDIFRFSSEKLKQ